MLRRWLLSIIDQPISVEPIKVLQCLERTKGKTKPVSYIVSGVCGMRLVGSALSGDSTSRMIAVGEALDQDHFWQLWRHHSNGARLTWEDGSLVETPQTKTAKRHRQGP